MLDSSLARFPHEPKPHATAGRELNLESLQLPDELEQELAQYMEALSKRTGHRFVVTDYRIDQNGYMEFTYAIAGKRFIDRKTMTVWPRDTVVPPEIILDVNSKRGLMANPLFRGFNNGELSLRIQKPVRFRKDQLHTPPAGHRLVDAPTGAAGAPHNQAALAYVLRTARGLDSKPFLRPGEDVRAAIKRLQNAFGLLDTGIIRPGDDTERALLSLLDPSRARVRGVPGTDMVVIETGPRPEGPPNATLYAKIGRDAVGAEDRERLEAFADAVFKTYGLHLRIAGKSAGKGYILEFAGVQLLDRHGNPAGSGFMGGDRVNALRALAKRHGLLADAGGG